MNEASSNNMDVTIALPLGVVANQLTKIETNLRLLSTKAGDFAKERDDGGLCGSIAAKLDDINGLLDSIRCIVSNIEADLRTGTTDAADARKPRHEQDD